MKQIRTTDPNAIAQHIRDNFPRNYDLQQYTLVCVVGGDNDGNGYVVGIADRDIPGYSPTGIIVDLHDYNRASDIVMNAAIILIPDQTKMESLEIIATTMKPNFKTIN